MTDRHRLQAIEDGALPEYPLSADDRMDSHFFMPWERRRWLNSDMRLKGTPECRALYFDLICISCDQAPIGTLPDDPDTLAKLLHVEPGHFRALIRLPFGPLHKWRRCLAEGEVRLMHPFVLKVLLESFARKEDNRARTEAANAKKRIQRLRETLAGYQPQIAKNDAAVRWIDEWLQENCMGYRKPQWIESAIAQWSDHMLRLGTRR